MLKVLLVSPKDPDKPGNLKYMMGGENTYTRTLIENPPKGVKFVHIDEALNSKEVEYLWSNSLLSLLVKLRILPISSGTKSIRIKGSFDLIHCHGYSIKTDAKIPIVLSDSSSNSLFLKDYLGWSKTRIRLGYSLRRLLFKILGVIDPDTNLEKADKLIVFSEFAKRVHIKLGADRKKIEVVYPGIPQKRLSRSLRSLQNDKPVNILFVGTWFERKGGVLLLKAFEKLQGKYPNIRLTIVGEVPKRYLTSSRYRSNNIKQFDYVPREKLMREFFPKADIFVLVPPKAEGFGFVVLEAMAFGIPAIVNDIYALGEIVADQKTGFVIKPNSLEQLEDKLDMLIRNSELRRKMGAAARQRFLGKFTILKTSEKLLLEYKKVASS